MFESLTHYIKESYVDILTYINTMGILGVLFNRWIGRVKIRVLVNESDSFFSFTNKNGLEVEIPIAFENIGDQQISISRIEVSYYYFTNNPNFYNFSWLGKILKPIKIFFSSICFRKKVNFSHTEKMSIMLQSGGVYYHPIIVAGIHKATPPMMPDDIKYLLARIKINIVKKGVVMKKVIIKRTLRSYN